MKQNRELIFRAWDGNKMHHWNSTNHNDVEYVKKEYSRYPRYPYPYLHYLPISWLSGDSNDWIWMQYTGLGCKDLNGIKQRIYEGDIIKHKSGLKSVVEWSEEKMGWSMRCLSKKTVTFDGDIDTLIGNIYQNKKLLNHETRNRRRNLGIERGTARKSRGVAKGRQCKVRKN